MNSKNLFAFLLSAVLTLLASCATPPGTPSGASTPSLSPDRSLEPAPPLPVLPPEWGGLKPTTARQAEPERDGIKVFPGTGNLVKPAQPPKPEVKEPEEISLNFEGVDIRTVVETILGQYLREPYLVHPNLTGNVTLRTTRGISRKELVPTLEMLLRQNGFALVREDGLYKVVPFSQVRGSVTPQLGGASTPIPNGFSVLVVPLRYIGAKAMTQLLEPFTTDGSAVRADEVRNLVVLAGGQRELRHLLETIDLFDVDFLAGMSVGLFPIKSANVKELVGEIDKVFGAAANNPLAGIVRIIPIERLNALLIVTTQPRYLDEAKKWIERLDQTSPRSGGLFVYQVKNGKAENLAGLLSEIFGGKSSSTSAAPQLAPGARPAEIRSPVTPGQSAASSTTSSSGVAQGVSQFQGDGILVSKDVRVVADKDNNALLIIASQADYEKIEQALKQLDVVRRQVLVEVLIAEVRMNDDLRYGIEWFVNARNGTVGALRFPGGTSPVLSPVLPRTPGSRDTSGNIVDPRTIVPSTTGLQLINLVGGDIRAILQALGTEGRAQLISTPQIMALDNEKAQIKVGERISVQTGSQTTGTTSGTITTEQYIDTGVLLTVTPRINASGQVTMEVNQEVSEIGDARSGSSNPNIISRNFQTSATVSSGETMVLAGLMKKNKRNSSAGVPLLSKIPIIGGAFGVQNFAEERNELVILITPRVVSSVSQAQDVTNELRRKLPALEGLLPKIEQK